MLCSVLFIWQCIIEWVLNGLICRLLVLLCVVCVSNVLIMWIIGVLFCVFSRLVIFGMFCINWFRLILFLVVFIMVVVLLLLWYCLFKCCCQVVVFSIWNGSGLCCWCSLVMVYVVVLVVLSSIGLLLVLDSIMLWLCIYVYGSGIMVFMV